ncbi:two-component sensor histidine kinase [Paenibacillus marchantiophytorum]|uniref:histidine kinase n=1 Tax=Paenibacillus marchantiophytorum TaxID=1619310 RepID=A0ABQ1EYG3_9BACL|nr:HAMP domain-containing sensor histidine kinase [Paenibacillus marchantiophytorum]GFZ91159.1 two-component sensor histidine kinase [Paenibacillus marchantiophytorum]
MRRRSVTMKLFVTTAFFFLFFYAIVLLGQLNLFESFYQYQKTATLEKKLHAFSELYEKKRWDDARLSREIGLFINQNKAQLAILGPEGNMKHDNLFRIVIREDNGNQVRVSLSFMLNSVSRKLLEANFKLGDHIEAEGVFEDTKSKDLLYPVVIQKSGSKAINIQEADSNEPVEKVSGVITEVLLPSSNQWNSRQGILYIALDEWFPLSEERKGVLQAGGSIIEEWTDRVSETRSVVMIRPVMRDGKLSEVIFVLASLQQISEAYDALRLFYTYMGIGGILLIVLLSLVFTKLVSKPLIKLNQVALRMVKLDFSVKSHIRRNDEIGSLSSSLNSLSEKLDNTLKELYDANEQLQLDMAHKLRMEQRQKEFISDISHELKTPLSIVKGYVEGIRDGIGENKRERYLEVILGETDKMEALINDMLELAKLESQSIKLRKSSFLLSQQLEDIVDKLSNHLNEKQLKVAAVIIGEHAVHADQVKMEQMLVNLLMNAIRHATVGSEIAVRIESEGEHMRMEIENEGEAIPEDQLETIWERFYRVEKSRNRKTGGTGLGLAIVKQILDLHESRYGVENTKQGVKFYFYL